MWLGRMQSFDDSSDLCRHFDGGVVANVAQRDEDGARDRSANVAPQTRKRSQRIAIAGDDDGGKFQLMEALGKINRAATVVPTEPCFALRDQGVVDEPLHRIGCDVAHHGRSLESFDA